MVQTQAPVSVLAGLLLLPANLVHANLVHSNLVHANLVHINLVHAKLVLVWRAGVYVYKDENVGLTEPASPSCVNISISASCSRIRLLSLTCSDHQNTAGLLIHSLVLYIIHSAHLFSAHGAATAGHHSQVQAVVAAVHSHAGLCGIL